MNSPWNLNIISINVNGLKSDMWTKLRTLHKMRYDIILLQETKLTYTDMTDDLEYRWEQVSDGVAYTEPALSAQVGGVAILLSARACDRLTNRQIINSPSEPHRYLAISATLNDEVIYIHTVYAPVHRQDRPGFFNSLTIPTIPGSHIIGGDFNCVLDTQIDTIGDHNIASYGSAELITWVTSLNAIDAWRQQHGELKEFTSPSGKSRIDMIFLSGCFTNKFNAEHISRTIGSDHLCPTISTASSDISAKGGHWQLPTWLAKKAARNIQDTLQNLADSSTQPNYLRRFAHAMKRVTAKCKATHKQVLRCRKNKVDRARLQWSRAHMRAMANPTDELIEDAERARRSWIKEVSTDEQRKRAWAFDKHFVEAERCTRFFLTRANRGSTTVIPGVRRSDGSVSSERSQIQDAHTKFWTNLYSANAGGSESPPSQQNINALTSVPIPRLQTSASLTLEADITTDEIVRQIQRLPSRKAAGADGLRGELFKQAPILWAKVLLPIFHHLLHEQKNLPDTFHESIIILLHKKGCTLHPENYRPIALLNVMAKLLSSVYCARIRRKISKVIPNEQTGFVPGRSITENLILLGDAIHYSKRFHPSSIILALDFAKAYDRVQWRPMISILGKMGFGPRFLNVIKAMYKQRRAQLAINGELTNHFDIERGVLQGDPLSPTLFILACSPLYAKLEAARDAHGIPLCNERPAPVATFYADDTTIIARSPASASHLYSIAEWFCENSGAALHRGKCIAIATGPAPSSLDNGITILPATECTTILGVPMGRSITRSQQVGRVIEKMMQKCKSWGHVGRTIEGRVTVARAIILSTIWYVMAALPSVPAESKKIHAVVNNFINRKEQGDWGAPARRGNMTCEWFYTPKAAGGWGLAPVLRSLRCRKLALLKNFLTDRYKNVTNPWHTFAIHMIRRHTQGWCKDWEGITMWHGVQKLGEFGIGDWNALSPWWRDAWSEWLKLELVPARNSIPRQRLTNWPVWNNRILAREHGIQSTLRQYFTNSTTRAHMSVIRKEGFLTFADFLNQNGSVMSGDDLYTALTVCRSVNGTEHVVPRPICTKLMRVINALWTNTTNKWLLNVAHPSQENHIRWFHSSNNKTHFNAMKNGIISKILMLNESKRANLRLIKLRGEPIKTCWAREQRSLAVLAPSRRDVMRRLIRNALPVGARRVHWTSDAQTLCMLCHEGKIETTRHLFWDCTYAKDVWGTLASPWRTHRDSAITWDQVLLGYEVRLERRQNAQIEQAWAIVRACVVRCIWFERNRRYFYPTSPRKTPAFRHNQGADDIKMHIESWLRRADTKEKEEIVTIVTAAKRCSSAYANIASTPPSTSYTPM